jgi:hypothetical protein
MVSGRLHHHVGQMRRQSSQKVRIVCATTADQQAV